MADEIQRLQAENEKLRDRVSLLERRCGHLMVDADRREERATKIAEDCAEHGKEIQYLRHMANWQWAAANQQQSARWAIVTALGNTEMGLAHRSEPVPVDVLATWLRKAIDAQSKVLRRADGYPTLADCLRGGGCEHEGLSDGLKAEIAGALGLTEPAPRHDYVFGNEAP